MSEEKQYRLSIGYRNSTDVDELRQALTETDIKVVSYDQDAQRVFDNAVRLDADVVLITPDCVGYRTAILQDLLFYRNKSIPVIGWVDATTDKGRQMMANGAVGYITMPLDAVQVSNLINTVHEVVDRERQRRASGETLQVQREAPGDSAAFGSLAKQGDLCIRAKGRRITPHDDGGEPERGALAPDDGQPVHDVVGL